MATDRERLLKKAAARGKYAPLYRHLLSLAPKKEWRAGFGELERVLGFRLPDSARLHRPWWANSRKGSGHSHAARLAGGGMGGRRGSIWRRRRFCSYASRSRRRKPVPSITSKARTA